MSQGVFVGVDGCPAGWFSVGLNMDGSLVRSGVFDCFGGLLESNSDAEVVLVDMPIGLPEGPGGRECDKQAGDKLKWPRRASVFPTPTRQTVGHAAAAPKAYDDAVRVERQVAHKGISRQSFNIAPKISEVDCALIRRPDYRPGQVREVHPEVCFWALSDFGPMKVGKKKAMDGLTGEEERIRVLGRHLAQTRNIFDGLASAYPRSRVARDDILDALAAAVTGWLGMTGRGRLATLPAQPPRDSRGLSMEMVYCEPHSQTVSDRD